MNDPIAGYVLLAALAILQCLDGWTTLRILNAGGRELNPVMRWVIEAVGLEPALVIKGIAVVLVAWALFPPLVIGGMCLFYVGVVAFNWRSLK